MSSIEKNSTSPASYYHSCLFLSDVHLGGFSGEANRKLEQDVIRLVAWCENNKLPIIILGDFFDYWMEYPDRVPPVGQKLLEHFRNYHRKNNLSTLYVTGNHDNWTSGYLESFGFDIEHEYRIIATPAGNTLVFHGDGFRDPAMNFPRPLLHRLLRNSYFVSIYQTLLPPRLGWKLMKMYSKTGKKESDHPESLKMRAHLNTWARDRVRSEPELQAVIFGHHHHPFIENVDGKTSMNCGSFALERTAGLYTNENFQIVIWDGNKNKLVSRNRYNS